MEKTPSICPWIFFRNHFNNLWFCFLGTIPKNSNQNLGDDYTAAVDLANEEDIDAALLALDRIVDKGSDGYATIAKMKKASLLIEKGNYDEGLSIYLDLEKNAVDQSFRDIATILYVLKFNGSNRFGVLFKKIRTS